MISLLPATRFWRDATRRDTHYRYIACNVTRSLTLRYSLPFYWNPADLQTDGSFN